MGCILGGRPVARCWRIDVMRVEDMRIDVCEGRDVGGSGRLGLSILENHPSIIRAQR